MQHDDLAKGGARAQTGWKLEYDWVVVSEWLVLIVLVFGAMF